MATSGPENSREKNVFSSRRKVVSDDAARTAECRLFHARGAATENDRSPRVDRLTGELLWLTSAGDDSPRRCRVRKLGASSAMVPSRDGVLDWGREQAIAFPAILALIGEEHSLSGAINECLHECNSITGF